MDQVNHPHLTRRSLLAGVGSAAVAAGLAGCESDSDRRTTASPTAVDESALRRKIASLLVVGFRGERLDADDWIMKAIRNGLGGVILFDREVKKTPRAT